MFFDFLNINIDIDIVSQSMMMGHNSAIVCVLQTMYSSLDTLVGILQMAKIPTKKVKGYVRVRRTFTFCCNLAEQIEI